VLLTFKRRLSIKEEKELLANWGVPQKVMDRIFTDYQYSEQSERLINTKKENAKNRGKAVIPKQQYRKVVVNVKTKEEWRSASEAAKYNQINKEVLVKKLCGIRKNDTDLIYKEELR